MKGFVPTPPGLVDAMVDKLFREHGPRSADTVLDPGCGTGAFIHGVLRWCERCQRPVPRIVGIESDGRLLDEARQNLAGIPQVQLLHEDFLAPRSEQFDYIIGNPPYVPITGLSVAEREEYRGRFRTARGRFDLYLLFFEQALRVLKPGGRLVFVTPEKYLYVQTAAPLRRELHRVAIEEIHLIEESAFGDLVTYPTITTVSANGGSAATRIILRDGTVTTTRLAADISWLPLINGRNGGGDGPTLADAFARISCGVATGADAIYVIDDSALSEALRPFAFPTLSGRSIVPGWAIRTSHSMLIPYARSGRLYAEAELGALGEYLREPARRERLLSRTCVARKPWYAFHENPPLADILKPKILCKDIGLRPWFVVDEGGTIVPRHSVYYLVPKDVASIHELCRHLNSTDAVEWLAGHCQRAANGFLRLQSHVLKQMPIPADLLSDPASAERATERAQNELFEAPAALATV